MKAINFFKYGFLSLILTFSLSACVDHIADEETLPSADVAFEYSIVDAEYIIDYYVGAQIQFINKSYLNGTPSWKFDGNHQFVKGDYNSDTIIVKFPDARQYQVSLTVNNKTITKPIFISDIKPILAIDTIEGEICEVLTTFVSFETKLPNPEGLEAVYVWTFPKGTINEAGEEVSAFEGLNPGRVKFGNVGSQTVRLNVSLGGRPLEEVRLNVQVAYNEDVPTLYYAVKNGNIMALKLPANAPKDMEITPFDMGVKSGQHPFNIIFAQDALYILDAGMQFVYVNDVDGVLGDGRINVMSKDGSKVETMITHTGGTAFNDPFYGYSDGTYLYVANRNTGFYKISLSERNVTFSTETYPWYVQNDHLGYYNNGYVYGAMNACFGKINDTWYWCKTYNGTGIYRFTDADILKAARTDTDPAPAAGYVLSAYTPKSFVYDSKNDMFYFSIFGNNRDGVYRCSLAELDNIVPANIADYQLKTAEGATVATPTENGVGEGSSGEYIGICQMALDEATGNVYFGVRSADPLVKSGLYRYNVSTNVLECVVENVNIYGVAINQIPSKLF